MKGGNLSKKSEKFNFGCFVTLSILSEDYPLIDSENGKADSSSCQETFIRFSVQLNSEKFQLIIVPMTKVMRNSQPISFGFDYMTIPPTFE